MKSAKLRAPFAWIGGKSKLADDIVAMMPDHRLYVEVFGGALNVLYRKPVPTGRNAEVVNDINGDLVNLHRMIQRRPETLSHYLQRMLISREIFYDTLSVRLKPQSAIERAAFYYYLLTQSFGSKGTTFAMNAKSRRPKDIYRSFHKWSQRLKFVTIEHKSFEQLIREYDRPDAFFYCDPPYVDTESYYKDTGGFGEAEHRLLAELLHGVQGKFLLSYNDHPMIRELHNGFKITSTREIDYTLRGANHCKRVQEIVITNY